MQMQGESSMIIYFVKSLWKYHLQTI